MSPPEAVSTAAASTIDVATAAWLGLLQGVAEFLPISSSGHLSLAQIRMGIDASHGGHQFNIVVHAATLLAVTWVYRSDLVRLLQSLWSPSDRDGRRMLAAIVIGSSPLVVVLAPGVRDLVLWAEGSLLAIGSAFLVTAVLLATCRRRPGADESGAFQAPTWKQALIIGVAQLCAVAPGLSRAGSTIAAGLAVGLGRAQAARFSFLLSLPAVSAATVLEVIEVLGAEQMAFEPEPYLVGFLVSFVVGLLSLRLLLGILARYGLVPFVPYLVLMAGLAFWWA